MTRTIPKPSTKQEFEAWLYQAGNYFSTDGELVHHAICQLARQFGEDLTLGETLNLVYSGKITEDAIRKRLQA